MNNSIIMGERFDAANVFNSKQRKLLAKMSQERNIPENDNPELK